MTQSERVQLSNFNCKNLLLQETIPLNLNDTKYP